MPTKANPALGAPGSHDNDLPPKPIDLTLAPPRPEAQADPELPDCLKRAKPRPFQVMPPLSAADHSALESDIAARGVQDPVEYDQDGNVIDGHTRVEICEKLGHHGMAAHRPHLCE